MLGSNSIHWERYLKPLGEEIEYSDGYPLHPQEFDNIFNQHLVRFGEIQYLHLIVILGEPGIGKTTLFKDWFQDVKTNHLEKDCVKGFFLGEDDSYKDLISVILNKEKFSEDNPDPNNFYIFIDGLDEGIRRFDQIVIGLNTLFNSLPKERLFVRISSRFSNWTSEIEYSLTSLFTDFEISKFEISPLFRSDIQKAARDYSVDETGLLSEIKERHLEVLAQKPFSLLLLLDQFKESNTLPSSRSDLYLVICEKYCQNRSYPIDKIRIMISQIALLYVFSNKVVYSQETLGEISEENSFDANTLLELKHLTLPDQQKVEISPDLIKNSFDTPFFRKMSNNIYEWIHISFAEYFAAKYLIDNKITLGRIYSLVYQGFPRLPPQMYGITSWICELEQKFVPEFLKTNPEILLFSDTTNFSNDNKKGLLFKMVEKFSKKEISPYWFNYQLFSSLSYEGIGQDLRNLLKENSSDPLSLIALLGITGTMIISECQEILCDFLIGGQFNHQERIDILLTLKRLQLTPRTKRKLMKILYYNDQQDENAVLRWQALTILWPDTLQTGKLCELSIFQQSPTRTSEFYTFLEHFLAHFSTQDFPFILKWLIKYCADISNSSILEEGLMNVFSRIWHSPQLPEILDLFANAVWKLIKVNWGYINFNQKERWTKIFDENVDRRHFLISRIIPLIQEPDKEIYYLDEGMSALVKESDVSWIWEKVKNSSPIERNAWEHLFHRISRPLNKDHLDLIKKITPNLTFLYEKYCEIILSENPEDFVIKKAEEIEKEYYRITFPQPQRYDPQIALQQLFDDTVTKTWEDFVIWFYTDKNGRHDAHSLVELDIQDTPNWFKLPDEQRRDIENRALIYIQNNNFPHNEHYFSPREISGCLAFKLLIESSKLESINDAQLQPWVPTLLDETPQRNEYFDSVSDRIRQMIDLRRFSKEDGNEDSRWDLWFQLMCAEKGELGPIWKVFEEEIPKRASLKGEVFLSELAKKRFRGLLLPLLKKTEVLADRPFDRNYKLIQFLFKRMPDLVEGSLFSILDRDIRVNNNVSDITKFQPIFTNERFGAPFLKYGRNKKLSWTVRCNFFNVLIQYNFQPAIDYLLNRLPEKPPTSGDQVLEVIFAIKTLIKFQQVSDFNAVFRFFNFHQIYYQLVQLDTYHIKNILPQLSEEQLGEIYALEQKCFRDSQRGVTEEVRLELIKRGTDQAKKVFQSLIAQFPEYNSLHWALYDCTSTGLSRTYPTLSVFECLSLAAKDLDKKTFLSKRLNKTIEEIDKWLHNFEPNEETNAFRLLNNVFFYNENTFRDNLRQLFERIKILIYQNTRPQTRNTYLLNDASGGTSSTWVSREFRKAVGFREEQIIDIFNLISKKISHSNLIFLDDIAVTGGDLEKRWKNLLKNKRIKKVLKSNNLILGLLFISQKAIKKLMNLFSKNKISVKIAVISNHILDNDLYSFRESGLFTLNEVKSVTKMLTKYGNELYKGHSLGFGNFGLLITFYENTPNNTLPILWQSSTPGKNPSQYCSNKLEWFPLFPRK